MHASAKGRALGSGNLYYMVYINVDKQRMIDDALYLQKYFDSKGSSTRNLILFCSVHNSNFICNCNIYELLF